jgi:hypothetical protein
VNGALKFYSLNMIASPPRTIKHSGLTRTKTTFGFLLVFVVSASYLFAGDAVVIGYNADGVWTAVTYHCSSSPKGGRDYRDKVQAREAARRDLRRRGGGQMVRSRILDQSDHTGYVAVARGETDTGADLTVVGRGESQQKADEAALTQLSRGKANSKQKIVYRYFSYGTDDHLNR